MPTDESTVSVSLRKKDMIVEFLVQASRCLAPTNLFVHLGNRIQKCERLTSLNHNTEYIYLQILIDYFPFKKLISPTILWGIFILTLTNANLFYSQMISNSRYHNMLDNYNHYLRIPVKVNRHINSC